MPLPFSSLCRQHPSIQVVQGPEAAVLRVLTEQECTVAAVPPAWKMLAECLTIRATLHSSRRWCGPAAEALDGRGEDCPMSPFFSITLSRPHPAHFLPHPSKESQGSQRCMLNLPCRPPGVLCTHSTAVTVGAELYVNATHVQLVAVHDHKGRESHEPQP